MAEGETDYSEIYSRSLLHGKDLLKSVPRRSYIGHAMLRSGQQPSIGYGQADRASMRFENETTRFVSAALLCQE